MRTRARWALVFLGLAVPIRAMADDRGLRTYELVDGDEMRVGPDDLRCAYPLTPRVPLIRPRVHFVRELVRSAE